MTEKTFEELIAEGKPLEELIKTKEGALEVIGSLQNSFQTKFVYIQPNDLINELVAEGKLRMEVVSGLKCYGLVEEEEEVENGD